MPVSMVLLRVGESTGSEVENSECFSITFWYGLFVTEQFVTYLLFNNNLPKY